MVNLNLVSFILRAGLGVVFLYAAIDAYLNPSAWEFFIPAFITNIIPSTTVLFAHSIFQTSLAVWLLSGRHTRGAAIVSVVVLASIVVFNLGELQILFRDIAIIAMAIALYFVNTR
ncbi:MAG: hypothetical protein HYS87_02630 [Candidatus Colwellbacteria bacterium]|nr:hypothetical protein [Candidatus Colwellbacteria bacterium]